MGSNVNLPFYSYYELNNNTYEPKMKKSLLTDKALLHELNKL